MPPLDDPSPSAVAARYGLQRLGQRPRLGQYLRQMWQRRHFTHELAWSRFRADNARFRIGVAWVVIQPLINALVYGVIFSVLLQSDTRPANYATFLVAGVFVFQFFAGCLLDGAKSVTSSAGLVRALHFPRALLPVATVLEKVVALGPMMAVLAVLALVTGEGVALSWLLVPVVLALMTAFNAGVAMVAARLTAQLRDLTQVLPFASRVLFYASGIFYELDRVVVQQPLATVLAANPVHVYVTLVRACLMDGVPAPAWMWTAAVVWATAACVGGFLFFWRAEEEYGRE